MTFDALPAADDAAGQALLARLKGKRLPLGGPREVSIIDGSAAALAGLLNGQGRRDGAGAR
jgi:hypothetical protein